VGPCQSYHGKAKGCHLVYFCGIKGRDEKSVPKEKREKKNLKKSGDPRKESNKKRFEISFGMAQKGEGGGKKGKLEQERTETSEELPGKTAQTEKNPKSLQEEKRHAPKKKYIFEDRKKKAPDGKRKTKRREGGRTATSERVRGPKKPQMSTVNFVGLGYWLSRSPSKDWGKRRESCGGNKEKFARKDGNMRRRAPKDVSKRPKKKKSPR